MQPWFLFAILSAVFWGIEQFFHKFAAHKGLNTGSVTLIYSFTSVACSFLLFILLQSELSHISFLLATGIINALMVFVGFVTRLNALKHLSGSVFFPINKTGILIVMVAFSLLILHEPLELYQAGGLILAIVSILFLTKPSGSNSENITSAGLLLTVISTITFAGANIVTSYASKELAPYGYIFVAYFFIMLLSLLHRVLITKQTIDMRNIKSAEYRTGMYIGVFNVAGYVCFFLALQSGLFSIVGAVNNFSLLITIGMLYWVLKEVPTKLQLAGIGIAFASLFLLR